MQAELAYVAYITRGEQTGGRSQRYVTGCKLCGEEGKDGKVENYEEYRIKESGPTQMSNE